MSAQVAQPAKPRLLFVDDEKRVLNSMRAMFRRDYELYLTTRGDEALKIISERPIDVLVADQRMPLMTGVEVLTAAKKCSPGTVRILLTGYSDLDAIEGAMNDGEVFRFLNKPCAATELRGTIDEAARIARDTADQVRRSGSSDNDVSDADVEALSSAAASPLSVAATGPSLPERALRRRKPRPARKRSIAPVKTTRPGAKKPVATPPVAPPVAKTPLKTSAKTKPPGATPPAPRSDTAARADERSEDTVENPVLPSDFEPLEIVMAGDTVTVVDGTQPSPETAPTVQQSAAPAARDTAQARDADTEVEAPAALHPHPSSKIQCVGRGKYNISVMVFSPDDHFARSIGRALDGTFYTFHATNAVRLIEAIGKIAPAVLITDVTTDPDVIKNLTSMLKQRLPALVTMVAGKHRDAEIMISLINHGQVFRFVDKPLSSAGCHKHVRDALKRHIVLRRNPELAQRYAVRGGSKLGGALSDRIVRGLQRVKRLWGPDR